MNELVLVSFLVGAIFGAYLAIRECANAVLQNGWDWWKKAVYLAQQRYDYKQYCTELNEAKEFARLETRQPVARS